MEMSYMVFRKLLVIFCLLWYLEGIRKGSVSLCWFFCLYRVFWGSIRIAGFWVYLVVWGFRF